MKLHEHFTFLFSSAALAVASLCLVDVPAARNSASVGFHVGGGGSA
jgi:hypothetical protein